MFLCWFQQGDGAEIRTYQDQLETGTFCMIVMQEAISAEYIKVNIIVLYIKCYLTHLHPVFKDGMAPNVIMVILLYVQIAFFCYINISAYLFHISVMRPYDCFLFTETHFCILSS